MTELRRYSIGARGEKVFHGDGPHVSYADAQKLQRTPEEIEILLRASGLLSFASGYVQRPERREEFRKSAFDLATLIPGATIEEEQ